MPMSPRLLRPRQTGFDPRSIAGLALWLDGADANSVTLNGSTVSQWNDKSGNGRHATQATAASQPTFTANARNGRSALTFSGSQVMSVASFPVASYAAGIAVVQFGGNNQAAFQRGSLNDIHSLFTEAGLIRLRNIGAVNDATSSFAVGTFYVVGFSLHSQFTMNGTQTSDLRLNGTASPQSSYTFSSSAISDKGLTVGGLTATVYRLNGVLCELVYYQGTSALSPSSIKALESYAGKKWGIAVS